MEQSTVKWFDAKKGYGFINHPNGGEDVFVHYSQIDSDDDFKTLHTGQSVQFELNDGPKGVHAVSVQVEESEDDAADIDGAASASDNFSISQESTTSVESHL
ncbi:cold-shock protein [Longimonas sp.]|uniref:cold-shock protein n=1 Tax=Longimonas sp. TaxID=2039626 RepID=UPI00336587F8